jgi:decaprenylphospho-beta-D-erythro-pentofuranosid-2-ulose 2-reductase
LLNGFGKIQNVVLVGSTSEIGLAVIKHLPLAQDARFVLLGKSNLTKEEEAFFAGKTEVKFLDLRLEFDSNDTIDSIFFESDIDLVILAAGVLEANDLGNDANTVDLFSVNLVSQVRLLRGFSERLMQQRHGKILVVSSVATLRPRKNNYLYGASKVGLDFFSRGLMQELKPYNVQLTILRPGFVFTKMTKGLRPAPFAIDVNQAGLKGSNGLTRGRKIVYAPGILRFVLVVIRLLPNKILNKIE